MTRNERWISNVITIVGLVLLVALVSMQSPLFPGPPKVKNKGAGCTCPPPCACQDCPGHCGPCLRPPNR